MSGEAFGTIEVRIGRFKVEWRFCGEGRDGPFNPKDRQDAQLLRFMCYIQDAHVPGGWRQLENSSHLTELPTSTCVDKLLLAGRRIIEILVADWPHERYPTPEDGSPYSERLTLMSHISPNNFGLKPPPVNWPAEALTR